MLTLPFVVLGFILVPGVAMSQGNGSLVEPIASHLASLPMRCIGQEYPNKLDHVMNDAGEVKAPRVLHPAFYGCFDWHSSVHGHWMLVRLLKQFGNLANGRDVRSSLDRNLSAANLAAEAAYLDRPNRQSFERTYGWAWLLKLAEELSSWKDPDGQKWAGNLQPLTAALVARLEMFLPKQTYPIRTGVHPNTAFALAFTYDYAKATGDKRLEDLVVERSKTYFGSDRDYPAGWEPGGEDFFSPALMEADLMRRVLPGAEFVRWFDAFLPGVAQGNPSSLMTPAEVTDRTDPKLVHLDGLNLSRAWCFRSIAAALAPGHPARARMADAARRHAAAALPHVTSGDYAGEHWLASFAVYMLSTE